MVLLTNQIKACGESINNLQKIEKILSSLTINFDYIVVSIEESKSVAKMKLEELKASLETHNMRLKKRNSEREKVIEQAVQAKFIKKVEKEKDKRIKNLATTENSSKNSNNHNGSINKGMSNKNSRKKIDMKKV